MHHAPPAHCEPGSRRPDPLTFAQRNALCAIILLTDLNDGISPIYSELAEELGLKSKGQVHAHVANLAKKGWLRIVPHRARGIEVLHEPDVPEPEFVLSAQADASAHDPLDALFDAVVARRDMMAGFAPDVSGLDHLCFYAGRFVRGDRTDDTLLNLATGTLLALQQRRETREDPPC